DPVAGQAIGRRESTGPPLAIAHEAAALRPDPEVSLAILRDREHRRTEVLDVLEHGLSRPHAIEVSVRGAGPESPGAIFADGPDPVVGESFVARVVDDALALQSVQAAVGRPDPEAALAVF